MQSVVEEFRSCVAEGSETGMLIAADRFDESADRNLNKLGNLLRAFCEIQTYVRTSQPIPHDLGLRYQELNGEFNNYSHRTLPEYGCRFEEPLGPYYIGLTATQVALAANLNWLSDEPIRRLIITDASVNLGSGLAVILRNFRLDYINQLTITFRTNYNATPVDMGRAFRDLKTSQLQRLTIKNCRQSPIITAGFMAARGVPKGCELYVGERWAEARRVCVKK